MGKKEPKYLPKTSKINLIFFYKNSKLIYSGLFIFNTPGILKLDEFYSQIEF